MLARFPLAVLALMGGDQRRARLHPRVRAGEDLEVQRVVREADEADTGRIELKDDSLGLGQTVSAPRVDAIAGVARKLAGPSPVSEAAGDLAVSAGERVVSVRSPHGTQASVAASQEYPGVKTHPPEHALAAAAEVLSKQ